MPWKSQLEKDGFEAQRQVPPEISTRQIEEEIPVSWKADGMLWGYVSKYMLKRARLSLSASAARFSDVLGTRVHRFQRFISHKLRLVFWGTVVFHQCAWLR